MDWLWFCSSIICLAIGYSFGYHARDAYDTVTKLQKKVKQSIRKEPQQPDSKILELPLSPAEQIVREHEELMRKLNSNEI